MLGQRAAACLGLLLLLVPAATGVASSNTCMSGSARVGLCGSTDGHSLTVSGTQQQPGTDRTDGSAPRSAGPHAPKAPSEPSDEAKEFAECMSDTGTTRCARLPNTPAPPAATPPTPARRAITITDLERFAPASVRAATEPGNVGIAGMPTNFLAAATVQTQSGELFGSPLRVRFTPAGYDYTYGDGQSATKTAAGRTWKALGQAQFTPTRTSHIYRESGTYLADVDIRYTAEIDLGGGWLAVTGQLTTDGAPQRIRILDATTALVAHTCDEDPSGTGC